MKIVSGNGFPYEAGVNSDGQVLVRATIESLLSHESEEAATAFWLPTGLIALTSTVTDHGFLYFDSSNADDPLRLFAMRVSGTQAFQVKMYKNPTTGTLISGGAVGTAVNLNFKSSNPFSGTMKVGSEGLTVTNGTLMSQAACVAGVTQLSTEGAIILGLGNSIGFTIRPAVAGTFGMTALVAFAE